ncbi:MAG: DUF4263 domain-containing protein [Sandaracinaceae bacterium]
MISSPQTGARQAASHPEILQLAFGCHELHPETTLEWQYETDREDLRPDFMPVKMDGFADIVEFKLPWLKGKPVVGPATRTKPSAEVDTALAQIDEYEEWCAQDVNRRWLEEEKGIRVHAPMTYLVIGHQSEFTAEDRQRFRKRRNAIIVTYDEFVEMARHWSWVQ